MTNCGRTASAMTASSAPSRPVDGRGALSTGFRRATVNRVWRRNECRHHDPSQAATVARCHHAPELKLRLDHQSDGDDVHWTFVLTSIGEQTWGEYLLSAVLPFPALRRLLMETWCLKMDFVEEGLRERVAHGPAAIGGCLVRIAEDVHPREVGERAAARGRRPGRARRGPGADSRRRGGRAAAAASVSVACVGVVGWSVIRTHLLAGGREIQK